MANPAKDWQRILYSGIIYLLKYHEKLFSILYSISTPYVMYFLRKCVSNHLDNRYSVHVKINCIKLSVNSIRHFVLCISIGYIKLINCCKFRLRYILGKLTNRLRYTEFLCSVWMMRKMIEKILSGIGSQKSQAWKMS